MSINRYDYNFLIEYCNKNNIVLEKDYINEKINLYNNKVKK